MGMHEANLAQLIHLGVVIYDTFAPVFPDAFADVMMRCANCTREDTNAFMSKYVTGIVPPLFVYLFLLSLLFLSLYYNYTKFNITLIIHPFFFYFRLLVNIWLIYSGNQLKWLPYPKWDL